MVIFDFKNNVMVRGTDNKNRFKMFVISIFNKTLINSNACPAIFVQRRPDPPGPLLQAGMVKAVQTVPDDPKPLLHTFPIPAFYRVRQAVLVPADVRTPECGYYCV